MGSMMGGGTGAWMVLWIFVSLAVVAAGGGLIARGLARRRRSEPPTIHPGESPAVQRAQDALKLRYAHGEIGREEYLQGKVELED